MAHFESESIRENLLTIPRLRTEGVHGGCGHGRDVPSDASAGNGDDLERQDEVALIPSGGPRSGHATGTSPADDDDDAGGAAGTLPPSSSLTGLQVVVLAACLLLWASLFACAKAPLIREKLLGLIEVNVSSGCQGLVGGALLIVGQLALGARKRARVKNAADEASRKLTLRAFGRAPRVAAVIATQLCVGPFVHSYIEMSFRGMLPLVLAAKTGAPTAVVVVLSSGTYGIIAWLLTRRSSRGVLVSYTVVGAWMHALVLSTGSIFVPIVAHTVYETFFGTIAHVQATRPPQGVEMAPREQ